MPNINGTGRNGLPIGVDVIAGQMKAPFPKSMEKGAFACGSLLYVRRGFYGQRLRRK